jgi:uncharacterized membrane protein YkvA (DUF1232 family)
MDPYRPLRSVSSFFRKLLGFIRDVAHDSRIPARDRWLLLLLAVAIPSPLDLIPDWIPVLGELDDLIYLALITDYLFRVLDPEILLQHYPWGMKSFAVIRRTGRTLGLLAPPGVRTHIWKFVANPYRPVR